LSSPELRTAKETDPKNRDECSLLIEAQVDDAARILEEFGSATDERFLVEWVTELSSGIERLRNGGAGAVVLDLTLPDRHGVETFAKPFRAAPRVTTLILNGADAEEIARQAVQHGTQDDLVKDPADGYGGHDDGSLCSGRYVVGKGSRQRHA
jgi:DNA-binding NtrC family response regulator